MSVPAAPTDSSHDGRDLSHTLLVLGARWRAVVNSVQNIRRHMYVHFAVGIGLVLLLIGGGYRLFRSVFGFLMRQEVFGPVLMDMLMGLVFLIFFSMLVFSNLIITLSTTYLSKEVEFLMAQPVSRQAIFRLKLVESVFYSSWAFALLTLPVFVAYGAARGVPLYFYPLAILASIPFLLIPAGLGSIITLVLTAYLPARKTRTLAIVLGILTVMGSLIMARFVVGGRLLASAEGQDFVKVMNVLGLGSFPALPSAWLANALQAIAPADAADFDLGKYFYWLAMLSATALFLLEILRLLVPPLYYRGWALSRDSAVQEVSSEARTSAFQYFERALWWMDPATRALLSKDMKTFWRDPSQWTQLVILVGLMVVYVGNLRTAQRYNHVISFLVSEWRSVLVFFNIAATCFILSILTTRFVYPLLSLEGRQFWTIGLAPMQRSRVLWQKYVLCAGVCLVISHGLTLLSNTILDVSPGYRVLSHLLATVMSLGLSSLSIGLGAMLPNFLEDNPARIANGVGGTLNVILSILYIGISVVSLAWALIYQPGFLWGSLGELMRPLYFGLVMGFHALVILVPLKAGLDAWEAHEF